MKIRKFNENADIIEISNEKVNSIIDDLSNIMSSVNKNKISIETISNDLSGYRSSSKKANDQIDDTVSDLEVIKTKVNDMIGLIENAVKNLKDYNQNGRKYLY